MSPDCATAEGRMARPDPSPPPAEREPPGVIGSDSPARPVLSAPGRVAGRSLTSRPYRSVRESLDSYGSCRLDHIQAEGTCLSNALTMSGNPCWSASRPMVICGSSGPPLGEAGLTEPVPLIGLEVQGGDVVKDQAGRAQPGLRRARSGPAPGIPWRTSEPRSRIMPP